MLSLLKKLNAMPKSMAKRHWQVYHMSDLLPDSSKGNKLLSLGCGDGGDRKLLEEAGFDVIGLDTRNLPGVDVIGDACDMPFEDSSFDVVISMQVLEHIPRPWLAVAEVSRVLKTKGIFAGSVAFLKPFHESYFHITHWGMRNLLEDSGFSLVKLFASQSAAASIGGGYFGINASSVIGEGMAALESLVMRARRSYWRLRHRDQALGSDDLDYHGEEKMLFPQLDRLRFGAAIVFKATKI